MEELSVANQSKVCWLNKIKNKSWFKLRQLNILLVVLIICFGFYYLTGIIDLTVKGFKLQELKQSASLLSEEKRSKEAAINNLKSYDSVKAKAEIMKMVSVSDVDYIVVSAAAVARK